MLRITIRKDKRGQFYSTFKAKNGKKRNHSESYTQKQGCRNNVLDIIEDIKNGDYAILDLTNGIKK